MIKRVDDQYAIALTGMKHGQVLMEGLFSSKDVNKLKGCGLSLDQLLVIYLDLPEADCLESVMIRREAQGKQRAPLKKHSEDYCEVSRAIGKLKTLGAIVEHHTRESAADRLEELLGA